MSHALASGTNPPVAFLFPIAPGAVHLAAEKRRDALAHVDPEPGAGGPPRVRGAPRDVDAARLAGAPRREDRGEEVGAHPAPGILHGKAQEQLLALAGGGVCSEGDEVDPAAAGVLRAVRGDCAAREGAPAGRTDSASGARRAACRVRRERPV